MSMLRISRDRDRMLEVSGRAWQEDRASGYWITRSDADPTLNARTSGVYLRAEAVDLAVLDGRDNQARAALIAERIEDWRSIANS